MTDRGRAALRLSSRKFEVGPSSMRWDGERLIVEIDEISTPHLTRLRGRIVLTPSAITDVELPLTADGAHVWRPFAPVAKIEVELDRPGWTWSGHGYLDANFGTRALETDFSHWCWGRFPTGAGGALAFYDAEMRDGSRFDAAFAFGPDGSARAVEAPPPVRFARSLWAVKRETRADPGFRPRQVMSMLEAPFYTRALVETEIGGERLTGVHEALDLDRFRGPWLMPMLAMRVPRRAGWTFRPGAETD